MYIFVLLIVEATRHAMVRKTNDGDQQGKYDSELLRYYIVENIAKNIPIVDCYTVKENRK